MVDKPVPHYAKPIVSQKLAEYANEEQDRVKNAFNPANFVSIGSLPSYVNPAFASQHRISMLEGGQGGSMKCGKAPAFFMEYEYMSDPYGLADELKSQDQAEKEQIRQQISGDRPFVAPGSCFQAKHEGTAPYVPEPYSTFQDEVLRQKWIHEKKVLPGPFLPVAGKGVLEKPTRAMLTDIMTHLYRILSEDWEDAQPTVFTTEEDLIVIYFSIKAIRNPDGIRSYMNVLTLRNESVCSYNLRKVSDGWGTETEDHHLMFALQPPWVRIRAFASAPMGLASSTASSSQ